MHVAKSHEASNSSHVENIRALFKHLDTDKNGTLSYEEIHGWLTHLNPKMSEKEIQQLYLEIDVDKNGVIQIDEFIDYVFYAKKSRPTVHVEPPQGEIAATSAVPRDWMRASLDAHNELRALHGVPPLAWSDDCYREAKEQADICQAQGKMIHGHPLGFHHGQNIFWCSRPGKSAQYAARTWHHEMEKPGWDFENPPQSTRGCGHFTAVVWKGTTHVGVATSEDGCFILANYYPPGNYVGRAAENVFPILDSMRANYEAILADRNAAPLQRSLSDPPLPQQTLQKQAFLASAADGSVTVQAESMTPELEALFQACPFKHKDKVAAAFAEGGAVVTATREQSGRTTSMSIVIKTGRKTTKMRGSWGCADR